MVALHELFSESGTENLAKFARKQLLCALGLNDAARARAVFARLPEAAQKDTLTQYLMFRVSLLDWDHRLGCQSIEYLARATEDGSNQEILYACIREANEVGDKICALSALRAVVENWDPGKASAASLPPIIRCSIRLITKIEEQSGMAEEEDQKGRYVNDLCTMFERGSSYYISSKTSLMPCRTRTDICFSRRLCKRGAS